MTPKIQRTYKGVTCTRTNITTDSVMVVYGKPYPALRHLWRLEGRYNKPAGQRPFLTSFAACRAYIADDDYWHGLLTPVEEAANARLFPGLGEP